MIVKRTQSFSVNLSHSPEVPPKVTLFHKLKNNGLIENGMVPGDHGLGQHKRLDQGRRQDKVSHPQRGKQDLVEAAGEDDAIVSVDALHCRQWAAGIAEFAVVIIFQNQGSSISRMLQNLDSPSERHGDSHRKLVARRQIQQAGVAELLTLRSRSIFIDRDRLQTRSQRFENRVGYLKARIFDQYPLPRIHQKPCHKIQSFLNARYDDNLFGFASHSSRCAEILRQYRAQRQISSSFAAQQIAAGDATQHLRSNLCPKSRGKEVESRQGCAESQAAGVYEELEGL